MNWLTDFCHNILVLTDFLLTYAIKCKNCDFLLIPPEKALKVVLLHTGNKYELVHLTENYEKIRFLLERVS